MKISIILGVVACGLLATSISAEEATSFGLGHSNIFVPVPMEVAPPVAEIEWVKPKNVMDKPPLRTNGKHFRLGTKAKQRAMTRAAKVGRGKISCRQAKRNIRKLSKLQYQTWYLENVDPYVQAHKIDMAVYDMRRSCKMAK